MWMKSIVVVSAVTFSLGLLRGCQTGTTATGIQVVAEPVHPRSGSADIELVGAQDAHVRIIVGANHLLDTLDAVKLTSWRAGDNAGAVTTPSPGGGGANSSFDLFLPIPGSADLAPCDALYYQWAIAYEDANGQRGMFVSEAFQWMPTKRRLANGTIEQAQCQEPPPPGA
jgi:hypothetical protein